MADGPATPSAPVAPAAPAAPAATPPSTPPASETIGGPFEVPERARVLQGAWDAAQKEQEKIEAEKSGQTPGAPAVDPQKKPEGDAAGKTPAPAAPGTPESTTEGTSTGVLKFRALGADRQFDLSKKEDAEEVTRRLALSYKVDDMTKEHDATVAREADGKYASFLAEKGLIVQDANKQWVYNPEGALKWIVDSTKAAYGQNAQQVLAQLQQAFGTLVGSQPAAPSNDDLSVIEKELDKDIPGDAVTLSLIGEIRKLRGEVSAKVDPILTARQQEEDARKAASEKQAAQEANAAFAKAHDVEIAKYPILGKTPEGASEEQKQQILDTHRRAMAAKASELYHTGAATSPADALAKATKWYADLLVLQHGGTIQEKTQAQAAAMPAPAAPPPPSSARGGTAPTLPPKPKGADAAFGTEEREEGIADFIRNLNSRKAG